MSLNILSVKDLKIEELNHLVQEASSEQHSFMLRMKAEYIGNKNRFNQEGEAIFLALKDEKIIGFVGLNIDPYLEDKNVGRVRHLYVQTDYRRQKVAQALLQQLIAKAKQHFKILTLRTFHHEASCFYETLGFTNTPMIYASTHNLTLSDEDYLPESFITKIEKGLMVDGH
ncbi:MAG: GNAT family N-acetyltransferase [Candidatus Cloacimonetes bacterium]|nr:GNAT family N-acetyltransferase [Candidatus Cloacimonadota bacterium]